MTTPTLAVATPPTSAPRPDGLPIDTLMEAPMGHDTAEPTACAVPTVEASGDGPALLPYGPLGEAAAPFFPLHGPRPSAGGGGMTLIQTANGYLLCSVHAEAWQRGGNDVSMWPANEAEIVEGGGVCADCADEFDCDIVTCYRCGADYDESRGDGWCGLCAACADATEPQD